MGGVVEDVTGYLLGSYKLLQKFGLDSFVMGSHWRASVGMLCHIIYTLILTVCFMETRVKGVRSGSQETH